MLLDVSDADEVLRRLDGDPVFRAEVEADPAGVLGGLDLSDDDLARIDAALRSPGESVERFFAATGRPWGRRRSDPRPRRTDPTTTSPTGDRPERQTQT